MGGRRSLQFADSRSVIMEDKRHLFYNLQLPARYFTGARFCCKGVRPQLLRMRDRLKVKPRFLDCSQSVVPPLDRIDYPQRY